MCLLVYVAAASIFFRRRIPYEEALLELFYPDEYPAYVQRTFVGIPFVCSRSSTLRAAGEGGARGRGGRGGEKSSLVDDGRSGGNGRSPPVSYNGRKDSEDISENDST